jgi:hypothetical protein
MSRLRTQWDERSYRARVVAAAIVVCGVVAGGLALATIPDAAGVLHGCYMKSSGQLRVIDNAVSGCKPNETAISWNAQGPPGVPGTPGDDGERGPSDAFYVDQRGSFASQSLDPATFKTLVRLTLPAGTFVANGVAALVGTTAYHTAQCRIGVTVGFLGDLLQTTIGGTPTAFGTMTLTAAFTLDAPAEVALLCRASSDDISTQPSTMTAIQVGTLTDQSP